MSTKLSLLVSTSLLVLATASAQAANHSKLELLPQTNGAAAQSKHTTVKQTTVKQTVDSKVVTTQTNEQKTGGSKFEPILNKFKPLDIKPVTTDHTSQQPIVTQFHQTHPVTATTPVLTTLATKATTPVLKSVTPVFVPTTPLVTHTTTFQKLDAADKGNVKGTVLPQITANQVANLQPAGQTATDLHPFVPLAKQPALQTNLVTNAKTLTTTPITSLPKLATTTPGKGLFTELHKIAGPLQQPKPLVDPLQAHQLKTASQAFLKLNQNGAISKANIQQFVGLNRLAGNEQEFSGAIGADKFRSVLGSINDRIVKGDVKVVPIVGGGQQTQGGDNSTIVINQSENGKTVFVPASQLSGPDKRTIDVNCSGCKVVIVGDHSNGGSVVDQKTVVVNGNGAKVVYLGDSANGGNGKAAGSVTDQSKTIINGNGDKFTDAGDKANGGSGQNGGKITDQSSVVVNGNGDKFKSGTDQAKGGNSGISPTNGNGGNGGSVTDAQSATINGNGDKVSLGGVNANGGNGGVSPVSANGGDGGDVTDKRTIDDQGQGNKTKFGGDQANGGDAGTN